MPRDKKLAAKFKKKPCLICGDSFSTTGHHVISYKSNPKLDVEWNMVALCFFHHRMIHDIGVITFYNLFPVFKKEIESRGFEYFNGKLIYPTIDI